MFAVEGFVGEFGRVGGRVVSVVGGRHQLRLFQHMQYLIAGERGGGGKTEE